MTSKILTSESEEDIIAVITEFFDAFEKQCVDHLQLASEFAIRYEILSSATNHSEFVADLSTLLKITRAESEALEGRITETLDSFFKSLETVSQEYPEINYKMIRKSFKGKQFPGCSEIQSQLNQLSELASWRFVDFKKERKSLDIFLKRQLAFLAKLH